MQWQGSLSVAAVDLPEARELVDLLPTRYSARPPVIHRLLNHAIVVAAEIAYFRAWGERDALHGALLVLDSDASIHILSRDHPEEFLEFRSFKPLVVLLRHPFPTDGRID